jgi:catalase
MLAHLRNVHDDLATGVADGLGMPLPEAATPAVAPRTDLPPSDALSILKNGPDSFAGRKLGVLVTDGTDAAVLGAVRTAVADAGAVLETIAPVVGGVTLSDGSVLKADQLVDGGPSVLYDAVVLLPSAKGVAALAARSTAKDFVSDAFAHHKFIGYNTAAAPLLETAGVAALLDDGCLKVTKSAAAKFVRRCAALRYWERDVQP